MGDNPPSADDTKVCPYCGETIKWAAIVCRYCGRDLATGAPASAPAAAPPPQVVYVEQKKGGGCWRAIGAVVVMALVLFACVFWAFPKTSSRVVRGATQSAPVAVATPTLTASELQNAAVPILYDKLARDTENYVGRLIHAAGTVVQVIEDGSRAQLRVNMDDDFSQTLFVEYPGYSTARVLEGDKVVMVARVDGRVSYKTVLGAQATLPDVTALWLQVIPN